MSELITRRTFLKAAGTAMAAAAAGGMLAGCGNGEYGATPGSPALPAIDSSTYADFGSFMLDLGPLSGQWTSRTTYQSDGWRHNYLYTGLKISALTSAVNLSTGNFTCMHNNEKLTVCSLGNFGLNDAKTGFKFITSVTVPAGQSNTVPLYIDLGPVNTTSLNVRGVFTVELKLGGKTATFKYQPIYDDPAIE